MIAQLTRYTAFKLSEQVIQIVGKEKIVFEKISFNSWVKLKSFTAKASVQAMYQPVCCYYHWQTAFLWVAWLCNIYWDTRKFPPKSISQTEISFNNVFMYGDKELILHSRQLDCIKVSQGKHKSEKRCMNKSTKWHDKRFACFVLWNICSSKKSRGH